MDHKAPKDKLEQQIQDGYKAACERDGKRYAPPGHNVLFPTDRLYYIWTGRLRGPANAGLVLSWFGRDDNNIIYSGLIRPDGKVLSFDSARYIYLDGSEPTAVIKDGYLEGTSCEGYHFPGKGKYPPFVHYS
jgi:hypothetical protein